MKKHTKTMPASRPVRLSSQELRPVRGGTMLSVMQKWANGGWEWEIDPSQGTIPA
jgi:hypothetical protein